MRYTRHDLLEDPAYPIPADILNVVQSTPRSALPAPSDPAFKSLSGRFDTHQEARIILRYVFPREHKLDNVWTWRKREDRFVKTVVPEYRDWSNREDELTVGFPQKAHIRSPEPCADPIMSSSWVWINPRRHRDA